jgi:hypothetical protein
VEGGIRDVLVDVWLRGRDDLDDLLDPAGTVKEGKGGQSRAKGRLSHLYQAGTHRYGISPRTSTFSIRPSSPTLPEPVAFSVQALSSPPWASVPTQSKRTREGGV